MLDRNVELQRGASGNPNYLREVFLDMDRNEPELDDDLINCILGLPVLGDTEALIHTATEYQIIREGIKWLNLTADDRVIDAGCSNGGVCFYGALTTEASWNGIERVQSRIEVAREVQRQFSIPNVSFTHGNVLDQDLSAATVFYMANPFGRNTRELVIEKLGRIAREKPIKVLTYWMHLESIPGLKLVRQTKRSETTENYFYDYFMLELFASD